MNVCFYDYFINLIISFRNKDFLLRNLYFYFIYNVLCLNRVEKHYHKLIGCHNFAITQAQINTINE